MSGSNPNGLGNTPENLGGNGIPPESGNSFSHFNPSNHSSHSNGEVNSNMHTMIPSNSLSELSIEQLSTLSQEELSKYSQQELQRCNLKLRSSGYNDVKFLKTRLETGEIFEPRHFKRFEKMCDAETQRFRVLKAINPHASEIAPNFSKVTDFALQVGTGNIK